MNVKALFIASIWIAWPLSLLAAELTVAPAGANGLHISASQAIKVTWESKPKELVLRFDKPITRVSVSPAAGGSWLAGISYGFDSLLVKLHTAARFEVTRPKTDLVAVRVELQSTARGQTAAGGGQLALELAKARLLLNRGDVQEALELLDILQTQYPAQKDLLLVAASAYAYAGYNRKALALFERAERIAPLSSEQQAERNRVRYEQSSFVRPRVEYIDSGSDSTQLRSDVSAEADIAGGSGATYVGGAHETNSFEMDELLLSDGRVAAVDVVRSRSALWVRHTTAEDSDLRGSVYLDGENVGAGAEVTLSDAAGRSRLAAEYQRPNWDYLSEIPGHGVRDRILARREQRVNRALQGAFGVAGQRYSLDHADDAATTVALNGEVGYALLLEQPLLRLVYGLNAEYDTDLDRRVNEAGQSYQPLDFKSYELHVFSLAADYRLAPLWTAGGYGGYAYDRENSDGNPHLGAYVKWSGARSLAAAVSYVRTYSTAGQGITGEAEDRLAAEVGWHF